MGLRLAQGFANEVVGTSKTSAFCGSGMAGSKTKLRISKRGVMWFGSWEMRKEFAV